MAQIEITKTAAQLAHRRAIATKLGLGPPILWVGWSKGTKDNSRSADGGVVWQTVEQEGWIAFLAELLGAELEQDLLAAASTIEMDGVKILVEERARLAPGKLTVEVRDGCFIVIHQTD